MFSANPPGDRGWPTIYWWQQQTSRSEQCALRGLCNGCQLIQVPCKWLPTGPVANKNKPPNHQGLCGKSPPLPRKPQLSNVKDGNAPVHGKVDNISWQLSFKQLWLTDMTVNTMHVNYKLKTDHNDCIQTAPIPAAYKNTNKNMGCYTHTQKKSGSETTGMWQQKEEYLIPFTKDVERLNCFSSVSKEKQIKISFFSKDHFNMSIWLNHNYELNIKLNNDHM